MLENITNLFMFIGGTGMFLYGMHIMADGMQKTAGNRMRDFLGMLTSNRFKAVLIGATITAIIQSSGATTVMVVGFVSAGLMSLSQAVGVIMGANIGTTITAWIVSLSQIGDSMKVLNPEFYAPLLIGIGAAIIMFSTSPKRRTAAEITIGIGLLFQGLSFMSDAISLYADAPIFRTVFTTLGYNPILGILSGAIVTGLLQSSSVSIGILQTLAMNGLVTVNAAIFITLGGNIGSCVTGLLSAIGSSRTAKRAAVMNLSFNVIGSLIFGIGGTVLFMALPTIAHHSITPVEISLFHTFFNMVMTLLVFPFADRIVDLSGFVVREKVGEAGGRAQGAEEARSIAHLDPRIFEQPAIAVAALSNEVASMGRLALENVNRSCDYCFTREEAELEKIFESEKRLNQMNKELGEYLVRANTLSVNDHQKLIITNLFNSLTDIERSGDHAENIAKEIQLLTERGLEFSETGQADLKEITEAVKEAFRLAVEARAERSMAIARKVSACEDLVDTLRDEQKERHIERLSRGECVPAAGIVFIEIIDNLERISDHAQNMAEYIMNEM
ncbi:MAG: Na/Pi cotransporter family protein [Stomatobaculum sp.]